MRRPFRRRAGGSSIVEGTVGFLIIILVTMACLVVVTGAGLAAYYKYKLGCVTDRATVCVAHHLYPMGAEDKYFPATNVPVLTANISVLVNQMLTDIGLPNTSQGATVNAQMVTGATSGRQFLVVTVVEPSLPIIQIPGSSTISIPLQDTAAAAVPMHVPPAILQVNASGGPGVVLPGYLPATPPTPKMSFQLCP